MLQNFSFITRGKITFASKVNRSSSRSRKSTKAALSSGLAELGALASAEEVRPLLVMVSEIEAGRGHGHPSRRKDAKVCNMMMK